MSWFLFAPGSPKARPIIKHLYKVGAEQILTDEKENDLEIEISLKEGNKRRENPHIKELLKNRYPEKINLRIVKLTLPNGKKEYLITSILDNKNFTLEDFNKIYNLRWNQEVYFDFQKNIMEVENFSGKSVETIKQDYYSIVLVGNLHSLKLYVPNAAQKQDGKPTSATTFSIRRGIFFDTQVTPIPAGRFRRISPGNGFPWICT